MITRVSLGRCLAVWAGATLAALAVLAFLAPDVGGLAAVFRGDLSPGRFDTLLARVGAGVGAGCVLWLWSVCTITVLEAATGRVRGRVPGCPPAVRRAVLAACGVAVISGLVAPAPVAPVQATPVNVDDRGPDRPSLVEGLPLPDRPSAGPGLAQRPPAPTPATPAPPRHRSAPPPAATAEPHTIVVRPGDSLWSIAAADLPPGASVPAVAARAEALYAANRAVIGADPDLILPAQRLRIPPQEES